MRKKCRWIRDPADRPLFPVEHKHASAVLTKIGRYNIYKDGVLVDSGDASFGKSKGEYITEPLIYRGLLADVNIRYQGIGSQSPISFLSPMSG